MARASRLHREGRGFEPLTAHHARHEALFRRACCRRGWRCGAAGCWSIACRHIRRLVHHPFGWPQAGRLAHFAVRREWGLRPYRIHRQHGIACRSGQNLGGGAFPVVAFVLARRDGQSQRRQGDPPSLVSPVRVWEEPPRHNGHTACTLLALTSVSQKLARPPSLFLSNF